MKKEKYTHAEVKIVEFEAEDVILTSGENPDDDYELERE